MSNKQSQETPRPPGSATAPPNPARIALLRQGSTPSLEPTCPPLVHRWLHSSQNTWKAFNVLDSRNLDRAQEQWEKEKQLNRAARDQDQHMDEREEHSEEYQYLQPDPSSELESWRVPVLEDNMWEADLRRDKLCAVFWKAEESSIMSASWFYDSATKLMPASSALASEIESLYQEIQPWTSSYCDELKSSVSLGAEGEGKLKCDLKSLKGSYVIFIGPFLARIYSENFSSRISKTIWTTFSGEHGGGSLLIRGFDNTDRFLKTKSGEKVPPSTGTRKHNRTSSNSSASISSPSKSISTSDLNSVAPPPSSSYESLTKRLSAQLGRPTKESSASLPSTQTRPRTGSMSSASGSTTPTKSSSPQLNGREGAESPLPRGAADPDAKERAEDRRKPRAISSSSLPPPQSVGTSSDLFRSLTSKFNSWGLGSLAYGPGEGQIEADPNGEPDSKAKSIAQDAMDSSDTPSREGDRDQEDEETDDDETEEEELERELQEKEQSVEVVLCLHGIGQRLATMPGWGNLDFTIALDAFRILVQNRSKTDPPAEVGGDGFRSILNGKRVQFIPVMWRSTLEDFKPTSEDEDEEDGSENYSKNEFELKDILGESDSIPLVKSLIEGVLLDIPLYLSRHKGLILRKVKKECNRLYRLFLQRNQNFLKNGGKVSILSHSLGTALAVDILSHQPTFVDQPLPKKGSKISQDNLEFDTKALLMCGSPVALFLWLNQSPLVARRGREASSSSESADKIVERKGISLDKTGKYGCLAVNRIANIFFTSDPIATRLNSTVDARLAKEMKALDVKHAVNTILKCLPGSNPQHDQHGESSPSVSSSSRLFGSWNRAALDAMSAGESEEDKEDGLGLDGAEGMFDKDDLGAEPDQSGVSEDGWMSRFTGPRKGRYADRPSSASKAEDRKLKKEWEQVKKPAFDEGAKEKDDQTDRSSTPTQDSAEKLSTLKGKHKAQTEEQKQKAYDRSEEKHIARQKFNSLNPLGVIDFSIPVAPSLISHQYMSYISMLFSHAGYWNDPLFADFILAMLFASDEQLAQARKKGSWVSASC